ncbi:hypothetical protein BD408DRAFT_418142 [Parasitella parasitica]|nr:hypothetical protein BD408DRAFT_418142 [Parasitella parasitica]
MLQDLPLEVLTKIAENLPVEETGEFARTCHKCYFAVLPHIWHQLTLNNAVELNQVANRLESNSVWAQRAIRFVRDFSFGNNDEQVNHPKFSSTLAASMFGIASSPAEQAAEEAEQSKKNASHERIGAFGKRLLRLFPHLSNLVFDFKEAARNFYSFPLPPPTPSLEEATSAAARTESNISHANDDSVDDNARLPFSGSVSLLNYKSGHSESMHYLLAPFRRTHHLKVEALPVVSLCDDIDESILSNADLQDLATLGLTHLRKLELSYLDSDIRLETFKVLLESMPNLNELSLEWIFPPNKNDFRELCQVIQNLAHLYPDHMHKKTSIYQVNFSPKQEKDK